MIRSVPPPVIVGASLTANEAGALAYALGAVTGTILLIVEPYRSDRLVRFHAYQSIFFFAAWSATALLWVLWRKAFDGATGIGQSRLAILLGLLVCLSSFLYWLFVLYKAYANERYEIPFVGGVAARLAR